MHFRVSLCEAEVGSLKERWREEEEGSERREEVGEEEWEGEKKVGREEWGRDQCILEDDLGLLQGGSNEDFPGSASYLHRRLRPLPLSALLRVMSSGILIPRCKVSLAI